MKDWKKLIAKILYPPIWLTIILVIVSGVSVTFILVKGWDKNPVAYLAYVVAFYTVTVVTLICIRVFPGWYRRIRGAVYSNKYGNRYMTDAVFKTHVSLYRSLIINMLYVAMNVVSFILYNSAWFIILAGYYTILAVMRFLLLRFFNKTGVGNDRIHEFRRSRVCGFILMTVNLTLSGAVLMMIYQNRGFEYHGVLIYIMAAYTFYITVYAVINLVKYRKYNSPVIITSKVINLSAAMVSVLSLETAMISQFGADSTPEFRRIMIAATGAGVSVIVILLSLYMIVKSTREIRKLISR